MTNVRPAVTVVVALGLLGATSIVLWTLVVVQRCLWYQPLHLPTSLLSSRTCSYLLGFGSFRSQSSLTDNLDANSTLTGVNTTGMDRDPDPWSCPGYHVTNVMRTSNGGLRASLRLSGTPCNVYGTDYDELVLEAVPETNDILRVRIWDKKGQQWQLPEEIVPASVQEDHWQDDGINSNTNDESEQPVTIKVVKTERYCFSFSERPFSFWVVRRETGEAIFDTRGKPIVFEDQYVSVRSWMPHGAFVYGFGETTDSFRRPNEGITTMWARDGWSPERSNSYGTHPFYMELRDGRAHGVFLRNAYGMDVVLGNAPARGSVEYRALGGVIDLFFFLGGESASPKSVIEQYTSIVGRPHMPTYWALGWQQCRWGYGSIEKVETVVRKYREANIPLEVMWSDIDYMDAYKDFTLDPQKFPLDKMQQLVSNLHKNYQKYVMIVDPAILRNFSYPTFVEGLEQGVFIKNRDGSVYYGQVWPGYTAFPDWFAQNTQAWWTAQFRRFLAQVPIDGIWLDMNEPASFCFGSCGSRQPINEHPKWPWLDPGPPKPDPVFDPSEPDYKLLNAPYRIHYVFDYLSTKTVAMNATHANNLTLYDTHNLFGHLEGIATWQTLTELRPNKRPFLVSRSTFAGSGKYEGHWSGDNYATWQDLYYSISQILNFQMFGIPYVGADVCGFQGNADMELCARWQLLGAFYPFARNHHTKDDHDQEPYLWPEVAEATRNALHVRYMLLPYYYTLFAHAHQSGTPVWRALMFEFPRDSNTWNNDRQFLIGPAILVTPVLEPGRQDIWGYLPEGVWYDYHTHVVHPGRLWHHLSVPLTHIPVHVRGGYIVLVQRPAYTTTESRKQPFELIVALDECGEASGDAYLDDGESLVPDQMLWVQFKFEQQMLEIGTFGSYAPKALLEKVTVLSTDSMHRVIDGLSLALGMNITVQVDTKTGLS